jgi:hypothetical protein
MSSPGKIEKKTSQFKNSPPSKVAFKTGQLSLPETASGRQPVKPITPPPTKLPAQLPTSSRPSNVPTNQPSLMPMHSSRNE